MDHGSTHAICGFQSFFKVRFSVNRRFEGVSLVGQGARRRGLRVELQRVSGRRSGWLAARTRWSVRSGWFAVVDRSRLTPFLNLA